METNERYAVSWSHALCYLIYKMDKLVFWPVDGGIPGAYWVMLSGQMLLRPHNEFDNIQYDTSDGLLKRSTRSSMSHCKIERANCLNIKIKTMLPTSYLTVEINWKGCYAFVCIFPAECIIWNQTPCTPPPWLCPLWPAALQHCRALLSLQHCDNNHCILHQEPAGAWGWPHCLLSIKQQLTKQWKAQHLNNLKMISFNEYYYSL